MVNLFHRNCRIKYNKYYILKFDISKFFASIDHDILKEKILRRIKDKDSLKIVFDIIDSIDCGLRNKEKLYLNNKTRIYSSSDNFLFLGRNCSGNPAKYRNVKRNIKNKIKLYNHKKITLRNLVSTIICYKNHYPNMFKDTSLF